ncbi:hypothetical protein YC2023_064725 [Brassica napus]
MFNPLVIALDVLQVGHLGETYEEWVHQPIVTKKGPRFFHSDFWEGPFTSRNRPTDSLGNIYLDVDRIHSSPVPFPHKDKELLGKHGTLSYSRMPSQAPNGPSSTRLSSCCYSSFMLSCKHLIIIHTISTIIPSFTQKKKLRSSYYYLVSQFWNLVKLFTTPSVTPALFGGGMLGYVMYDVTHYYLHHAHPTRAVTKNLKKYHLSHHFRIHDKGFGVTSSLWDILNNSTLANRLSPGDPNVTPLPKRYSLLSRFFCSLKLGFRVFEFRFLNQPLLSPPLFDDEELPIYVRVR